MCAYNLPFQWSHWIFLDMRCYGVMTLVFKSFCALEKIFPVRRWDHFSKQRTLALLQHVLFRDDIMLLEDFASLFNEGHVKQKPGRECTLVEKKNSYISVSNPLNCSFLVCASGDFLQTSVNQKPYRTYCIHPHTQAQTHTHSHQLWAFRADRNNMNTHAQLPLRNFRCAESSQTAFRLLTSCLCSISIYPSIFSSVFQSIHPSSVSRFVRCWHLVFGLKTGVFAFSKHGIKETWKECGRNWKRGFRTSGSLVLKWVFWMGFWLDAWNKFWGLSLTSSHSGSY